MNHPPNEEAALHFIGEVLPLIRARLPKSAVHLVGKHPSPRMRALQAEGVFVHGAVPDIRPYFQDAAVVVAPILSGGGTRLKILEAGACGKAIVSTSLGAEGLGLVHGRHLLLADDPAAFAGAVCELLMDAASRGRLGAAVRAATLAFDWAIIESRIAEIVSRLASESSGGTRS
jgi:glycosyltransferase involved in cell wall biosynthesis